jgi:hypothetical protein
MTTLAAPAVTRKVHHSSVLVTAPAMKFLIGLVAAICAVFGPRLIAALTAAEDPRIKFVSPEYLVLAVSFSVLVAVTIMILEWRVPRAPRDTFMTTLGVPAMLAGALSASQGATALQQAVATQEKLGQELQKIGGIKVESALRPAAEEDEQTVAGAVVDAIVTPAYAQERQAAHQAPAPPRLGIYVEEPRCFIVFDRAPKREDAAARMANLLARLSRTNPQQSLPLQVEKQGSEFLVVAAGGPRPKSAALLEALRLKDAYHVAPTLVEVQAGR